MKRLVEIKEEGRTLLRYVDDEPPVRSRLPAPFVISDTMPPTEQVDGQFYTSKKKFRDVGRAHGLIEVGNEKLKPRKRSTMQPQTRHERRSMIKTAMEKYKAGYRPGGKL